MSQLPDLHLPQGERFSRARRQALRRAAGASLSLLLPACSRTEPEKPAAKPGDTREGTLRLDLRHLRKGGADEFALERLRYEPQRLGDGKLAGDLGWGDYNLFVLDPASRQLLFRHGFDTGLDAASRAATTRFSVRLPMPRRPVRVSIQRRLGEVAFVEDIKASGLVAQTIRKNGVEGVTVAAAA